VPRLFVDAFGALPLRVAAGRLLYLGFEDRLDPVVALAVERMSGLRVESGLVQESLFGPAHARMLSAKFPAVELIEAGLGAGGGACAFKIHRTGAAGRVPAGQGARLPVAAGCGGGRRAGPMPERGSDSGSDLLDWGALKRRPES
jgi:hypothetical protein